MTQFVRSSYLPRMCIDPKLATKYLTMTLVDLDNEEVAEILRLCQVLWMKVIERAISHRISVS
jgi:hypothetical protein